MVNTSFLTSLPGSVSFVQTADEEDPDKDRGWSSCCYTVSFYLTCTNLYFCVLRKCIQTLRHFFSWIDLWASSSCQGHQHPVCQRGKFFKLFLFKILRPLSSWKLSGGGRIPTELSRTKNLFCSMTCQFKIQNQFVTFIKYSGAGRVGYMYSVDDCRISPSLVKKW